MGRKGPGSMTTEKPTELQYNPQLPLSQALLLPRIIIENTMQIGRAHV